MSRRIRTGIFPTTQASYGTKKVLRALKMIPDKKPNEVGVDAAEGDDQVSWQARADGLP
jgi:hypothetical protein